MNDINSPAEHTPIKDHSIRPKEITQDCDTGVNYASFSYHEGIQFAEANGLKQNSNNMNAGSFIVCCGDVMLKVEPTDYPHIERRGI